MRQQRQLSTNSGGDFTQSERRELVGPAQPSPTKRPEGSRTEDFEFKVEERRAALKQ